MMYFQKKNGLDLSATEIRNVAGYLALELKGAVHVQRHDSRTVCIDDVFMVGPEEIEEFMKDCGYKTVNP